MRSILFLAGVFATSSWAAGVGPKTLECSFSEPFFSLVLDTQAKKLTKIEIDWKNVDGPPVKTVIAKNLEIVVSPVEQTYKLEAKTRKGAVLLSATLNYAGNDGMSIVISPLAGKYFGEARTLYGGCVTETGGTYDYLYESHPYHQFVRNAATAVAQCYNRALSEWADAASAYKPNQSVFYTLYAREFPVGEPGGVSDTFSSAEGEQLMALVAKTKAPATDSASLLALRRAKWNYCDFYSKRLNSRIEAYGVNDE